MLFRYFIYSLFCNSLLFWDFFSRIYYIFSRVRTLFHRCSRYFDQSKQTVAIIDDVAIPALYVRIKLQAMNERVIRELEEERTRPKVTIHKCLTKLRYSFTERIIFFYRFFTSKLEWVILSTQ